jgi:glucokinase
VLGADVGGTQMRAALVDHEGNVLLRRAVATPGDAEVPEALIELVASVGRERHHGHISHAVVGLPGGVDYEAGKLLWAPHLPERWPDTLSRDVLSAGLDLPVWVANDADLAAVGEAYFGAGDGASDVAYLTISTGIGAGVLHGGRLVHGRRSLAEVGHTIIDWRAWLEGVPATLEEAGSGSGVARLARERALGDLDAKGVKAAAESGDAAAAAIWQDATAACAAGVNNLIMSFYPSVVVIGGGLGRREDFFESVRELVLAHSGHFPADLEVRRAMLGDDVGLVGAAAWDRAFDPHGR